MAVAGALFSLWLFGQTWNIFSQIGTVMLIGLVTKSRILIVRICEPTSRTKENQNTMPFREAPEAAFTTNLMTSLAIALGALPIAFIAWSGFCGRMGMECCNCKRNFVFVNLNFICNSSHLFNVVKKLKTPTRI